MQRVGCAGHGPPCIIAGDTATPVAKRSKPPGRPSEQLGEDVFYIRVVDGGMKADG